MPKVENAPEGLNKRLEEVYSACMKTTNDEKICSAVAWKEAKKDWFKANGVWKKKGSKRI